MGAVYGRGGRDPGPRRSFFGVQPPNEHRGRHRQVPWLTGPATLGSRLVGGCGGRFPFSANRSPLGPGGRQGRVCSVNRRWRSKTIGPVRPFMNNSFRLGLIIKSPAAASSPESTQPPASHSVSSVRRIRVTRYRSASRLCSSNSARADHRKSSFTRLNRAASSRRSLSRPSPAGLGQKAGIGTTLIACRAMLIRGGQRIDMHNLTYV